MCLELLDTLFSSSFAWAGLALLAVMGAVLAVRYLFTPSQNACAEQPSLGFTCPCYAPPEFSTEEKQGKTADPKK